MPKEHVSLLHQT